MVWLWVSSWLLVFTCLATSSPWLRWAANNFSHLPSHHKPCPYYQFNSSVFFPYRITEPRSLTRALRATAQQPGDQVASSWEASPRRQWEEMVGGKPDFLHWPDSRVNVRADCCFLPRVLPASNACPAPRALYLVLEHMPLCCPVQSSSFGHPGTQSPNFTASHVWLWQDFALIGKPSSSPSRGHLHSVQPNGCLFSGPLYWIADCSLLTLISVEDSVSRCSLIASGWGHRACCSMVIISLSLPAGKSEQMWVSFGWLLSNPPVAVHHHRTQGPHYFRPY